MLDDRKKAVLGALIEDFILTAEPVGSKRLVERYGLEISPATVRNELAQLEELGYISQPHISAGRIPTDLGYRFYVDRLKEAAETDGREAFQVNRFYAELNHEISQLIRETSHILSELTKCAALVSAPDIRKERIKHIDLVALGGQDALIVVITSKGSISKIVVDIGKHTTPAELSNLETTVNKVLADVPVESAAGRAFDFSGLGEREKLLVKRVHAHVVDSLAKNLAERVYFEGAAYLLAKPEITALARAHEVIDLLDKNYKLLEWLQAIADEREVFVSIGGENQLDIEGFSLVASGYEVGGESMGVLGILGPTRMDYSKAIGAVRTIARNLGEILAEL